MYAWHWFFQHSCCLPFQFLPNNHPAHLVRSRRPTQQSRSKPLNSRIRSNLRLNRLPAPRNGGRSTAKCAMGKMAMVRAIQPGK